MDLPIYGVKFFHLNHHGNLVTMAKQKVYFRMTPVKPVFSEKQGISSQTSQTSFH